MPHAGCCMRAKLVLIELPLPGDTADENDYHSCEHFSLPANRLKRILAVCYPPHPLMQAFHRRLAGLWRISRWMR